MEKLPSRVPTGDIDIIGLLIDHFFGAAGLFSGFGNLAAGIDDFLTNLTGAVTGTAPGTGNLAVVSDHIFGIQTVGVENSTAIAAINAAIGGGSGSGVYFVDTFDRANSSSLGSDWTVLDLPGVGVGIESNQAVAGTAANGTVFATCNTVALGDNMSVAIVAGSLLQSTFYDSGIHVRASTGMTAWVYLNVFKNKVYLGRATRSGSTVTSDDWVSVTSGISISMGTQIELRVTGTTYRAYVGGILVASYTDAAVAHPVGASYRSSGFKVRNDFLGRSLALSSFAMADITVPETVGTGWNLYRNASAAATSTTWGVSGTAFAASTFDVEDRKANVTVDNLGVGRVKILKAGWYTMSAHAVPSGTPPITSTVGLLGGTSSGAMSLIKVGQGGPDTGSSYAYGATFVVYCPADYYLQPCGWAQGSGSVALVGDTAGWKTNFSGALMG